MILYNTKGINGTVRPSRKLLRKRQMQKLKDDYLLSTGATLPPKNSLNNSNLFQPDNLTEMLQKTSSVRSVQVPNKQLKVQWQNNAQIVVKKTSSDTNSCIAYIVGPAYNKLGITCNEETNIAPGLSSEQGIQGNFSKLPYLSPTPKRSLSPSIKLGTAAINKKKLNMYLERLNIVRQQEQYNLVKSLKSFKSHPVFVDLVTMVIEEVRSLLL